MSPRLELKTDRDKVSRQLLDGVLFKIQNVHDYFMAHADEHNWHDPESIFAAKLPFDRVVFSYDHDFRPVPVTEFGNDIVADFRKPIRRHVNVVMEKATGADVLRCIAESLLSEKDGNELAHILDRRQPDTLIKTTLSMDGYAYPGTWFVMVDESGHCLTDPVHNQNWLWIRDPKQTAQLALLEMRVGDRASDAFARHGMICLTAVQFLNCRNVEVIDNPPTRQQRRHAERSGESAPVTYKTLVIHPMGQKRVKTHNADGTVVHSVALHIVRGHFKSYMSGAGLGRGHIHGVYWWSPSVRGNPERGRVEKDYEVNPD